MREAGCFLLSQAGHLWTEPCSSTFSFVQLSFWYEQETPLPTTLASKREAEYHTLQGWSIHAYVHTILHG